MVSTNILLGAVAGVTIFFGLLIARWRSASERMRGLLALASAGVLLFLIIEVGYRAMETVEAAAKGGSSQLALHYGLLFVVGLSVGMIGLAWLERGRLTRKSPGAEALEVATMILRVAPALDLTVDGRAAFDKLRNEIFGTLDPADPNPPVPASEVKALIERAERGLGG
ncbi:MAG TPA: hypothetical protein VF899_00885 [Pyrinomonadaceae bacterium]